MSYRLLPKLLENLTIHRSSPFPCHASRSTRNIRQALLLCSILHEVTRSAVASQSLPESGQKKRIRDRALWWYVQPVNFSWRCGCERPQYLQRARGNHHQLLMLDWNYATLDVHLHHVQPIKNDHHRNPHGLGTVNLEHCEKKKKNLSRFGTGWLGGQARMVQAVTK